MSEKAKIIFAATPEFAVPAFEALKANKNLEIVAVITQPDRPAGRGLTLTPPPVKIIAQQNGFIVFQPKSLKKLRLENAGAKKILSVDSTNSDSELKRLTEHLATFPTIQALVTVAYGNIIPVALIDYPQAGGINIHPSLLPRWRGAAPLQRAIFSGDKLTGVSLMQVDQGLDTGPVYIQESCEIVLTETTGSLHNKLALLGANMLNQALSRILSGELKPIPQNESLVTYANKWEIEDCNINWQEEATVIDRRIRASATKPGARSIFREEQVKVLTAHVIDFQTQALAVVPGEIVFVSKGALVVAAGHKTFLALDQLQLPGKKPIAIVEFLNGHDVKVGLKFSNIGN